MIEHQVPTVRASSFWGLSGGVWGLEKSGPLGNARVFCFGYPGVPNARLELSMG